LRSATPPPTPPQFRVHIAGGEQIVKKRRHQDDQKCQAFHRGVL